MGGEPLLRPQFAHKVCYYAAKLGFWIYLPTNARLMRPEVTDRLLDAGVATVNFAVDAVDIKPGLPKALNPVRKNFDYLLRKQYKYGTVVFFNMNICKNNIEDIKQLTEIAHDNGIATDYHINESPMIEQDHFQHYDNNSTYITKEDWPRVDELIDWLIEKNKSGYKMVNSVKRLNDMREFMRGKVEPWNCRAGQNSLIIRVDGSLAPCFPMYSATHNWGTIENHNFEVPQLDHMQSDIVNFQRQGWRAEEILAGLAAVLPKNVFLYVASIPNLAALGTRFVLQGGTQNNLAVVKAEVDFINNSFRASGKKAEVIVHEHCGESGAIGAATESVRLWKNGLKTSFVGLEAVRRIQYRTTRNEETRCYFCKNNCLRTFIDIKTDHDPSKDIIQIGKVTKVPLMQNEQRLIIATCEKGTVEDVNDMKDIKAGLDTIRDKYPNFVDMASKEVFRPVNAKSVADPIPTVSWLKAKETKERIKLMQARKTLRVGIPRVLNAYGYAPLFNGYLESLGLQPENIIYSDYTTPELYRAGASRGAIDPCYPAKIGIPHVYNLIQEKHKKKPLNVIFFPMYDVLHSPLVNLTGTNACPTVTATPATVKAAFTKENDVFAEHGITYLDPILNFKERKLFAMRKLPSSSAHRAKPSRACWVNFATSNWHNCAAPLSSSATKAAWKSW